MKKYTVEILTAGQLIRHKNNMVRTPAKIKNVFENQLVLLKTQIKALNLKANIYSDEGNEPIINLITKVTDEPVVEKIVEPVITNTNEEIKKETKSESPKKILESLLTKS